MPRTSVSSDSCSIHCDQPSHWQQTSTFLQFRIFIFSKTSPNSSHVLIERNSSNFVLSFKVTFLVISLPSWTRFLSFLQSRPLPDSLCLVIHLPVFVFTPLPVRLLTLLFSSLKLAFRLHFLTKPFLLLVLCCFIYIELAGSMERHALRMRELLEVKTSRRDTEWDREQNFRLPTLLTLTLQITAYKVCSIWSREQIENTVFHTAVNTKYKWVSINSRELSTDVIDGWYKAENAAHRYVRYSVFYKD